jgi:3-methyladenine DNA glycosylase AlkD
MSLEKLKSSVLEAKNPEKIKIYQNFFKTGKGEYGEGDIFYGLSVPQSRKIAKKYFSIPLQKTLSLLNSKIHEERLISLLILVEKFENSDISQKEKIVSEYLKNTKKINNWDLVDLSAPKILGSFLLNKKRSVLYKLANSKNLWEKRISIVSTYAFIKQNQFQDTLRISEILLEDKHDLIHKATGWMLREVGKKSPETLKNFLKYHYKTLPRTTLRYSIEKFPESERLKYLKGEI